MSEAIPERWAAPLGQLQVLKPTSRTQPSVFETSVISYLLERQAPEVVWSVALVRPGQVTASEGIPGEEPPIAYLQRKLSLSPKNVQRAVSIDPRTMHGNPVLQGTRIPLYQIIEELADGSSLEDLVEGYPGLTLEKIQAGLDFAASLLRVYDEPVFGRSKRQPEGD